jgi:2,3-bisphosphoglycerate-dependent phosphoglycerate mutase
MPVKRVIFIRPGETDWNQQVRWQGWVASPLNDLGNRQAERLANYIRHINLKALYTSDLKRALQTAGILASNLGFEPVPDGRLRERNIGEWQGLTIDEMRTWYPDEYQNLLTDAENYRVPGGESRADVRKRMVEAFDAILKQDKGETIGVISHTTAIHELLAAIIPDNTNQEVAVSNTSVTTIALSENGKWQLVASDDVLHLEGLPTQTSPELEDEE